VDHLIIRQAVEHDIERIGLLWERLAAFHQELDNRLPPAVPNGGRRYARRLYDKLHDDYARVLVAEIDGQIIGYVFGLIIDLSPDVFEQEVSGFLADIYVDEAYRKAGVGRALVNTLTDWFSHRGISYFEWHVAARNTDGVAFWRAVGGEPIMMRMRAPVVRSVR
jgi:GNAT superfamily N-acetyltransferase